MSLSVVKLSVDTAILYRNAVYLNTITGEGDKVPFKFAYSQVLTDNTKCVSGWWAVARYSLLFSAVENVPETATEEVLPSLQWRSRESREVDEKLTNSDALIDRIATLEKEQIYQTVRIDVLAHFSSLYVWCDQF